MKNIKKLFCTLLVVFTSFSFDSSSKKPKGDLILKGKIITDKWYIPNGKIKFFLEKDKNNDIKSISIGGSFLGFPKVGIAIISELEEGCLNELNISETIDEEVNITLENFDENGGYINILITTLDGLKEEVIYVFKTHKGTFDIYIVREFYISKIKSFDVYYSTVENVIINYEIKPK